MVSSKCRELYLVRAHAIFHEELHFNLSVWFEFPHLSRSLKTKHTKSGKKQTKQTYISIAYAFFLFSIFAAVVFVIVTATTAAGTETGTGTATVERSAGKKFTR